MSDENENIPTDSEKILAQWNATSFHEPNIRQQTEPILHAALAGKLSVPDFQNELLQARLRDSELHAIRAERPKAPTIHGNSDGGRDENVLAAASMLYFGKESLGEKVYGAPTMQRARDLGLRSVFDLARFALREKGLDGPTSGEALLKAAFSTTGLPVALGDSAGKIALGTYNEMPASWKSWCDVVPVGDFKQKKFVRLGHSVGLEELGPAGEIKHGSLSETTGSITAATYARMIAIPRQLLINDDLGLIPQVAQDFGKLAIRKVANLIYTALLANTGSFFSGAANNLIDDPLSSAGLTAALAAFRLQVDSDGEPVDIRPAVLLVPPSLEPTARQLLNSAELQRYVTSGTDNVPSGNPFANLGLTLEVEPRLESASYTGASGSLWFLMGPASAQVAIAAFLNGIQGPTVESAETDFETLGRQWRVWIDVGVALCDPKAGVMSSGA